MKDAIIFTFLGMVSMFGLAFVVLAVDTCPEGNGWVKIESSDYLPVEGAVEYCFKFGSPQSEGCTGGISRTWPPEVENYCGLSHWSYLLGTPTPTTIPTITPTPTSGCPTLTPIPSLTPSPLFTPTHSPTPTNVSSPTATPEPGPTATSKPEEPVDEWHKVEETPELYPAGDK